MTGSAATPVAELLAEARAHAAHGTTSAAWNACLQVAELARRAGDATGLADAAVVLRSSGDAWLNAEIHALCGEALQRLGSADPVRQAQLRAQLVATANPFLLDVAPVDPVGPRPEVDDAEATFLWLQARHSEELGIDGLAERVRIADAAVELGRRTGVEEYVCWGRRWRLDAFLTLGDPLGSAAELESLQPLVNRLDRPGWRQLLAMVRAVRHQTQGNFAAALRCVDEAVADAPSEETSFFALVLRSDIACLTGHGLDVVSAEVEARVDTMPYLARGWAARLAMARDDRSDGELLWRSLTPHIRRLPRQAPEWIVAQAGHAELCWWLGDTETAALLLPLLRPYAGLHVGVFGYAPYGGPVDLILGRLAHLLGDELTALDHLRVAERSATEIGARPYLALTRAALAELDVLPLDERHRYAQGAAQLAGRLGMAPLVAHCDRLLRLTSVEPTRLTPRETDIAALIAAGLSNTDIARRLTLSVRTVENHVSHVLDKLGFSSRAAVAAWYIRRAG